MLMSDERGANQKSQKAWGWRFYEGVVGVVSTRYVAWRVLAEREAGLKITLVINFWNTMRGSYFYFAIQNHQ
jgi:hypothetical protein